MTTEQNKLVDDGTFTSYADLPDGVRKHLLDLEVFIGEVDGKETVITLSDETCVDDGTLDSSDAVVAFNGVVAALRAAGSAEQTSWLIEWPQDDNVPVRWWNPSTGWMRDANKAMWLSRKSDAVDYISSHQFVTTVRPTEHQLLQAIRAVPAPSASVREDAAVADQIIGQIEDRFPDWRSYRDLIDCIDVTLHRLRAGARQ